MRNQGQGGTDPGGKTVPHAEGFGGGWPGCDRCGDRAGAGGGEGAGGTAGSSAERGYYE